MDFFNGKYSFAKLHRLIGQLPTDPSRSRYVAAQLDDDEVAKSMLEQNKKGSTHPPVDSWSTEVSYLATIADRLSMLVATIEAVNGHKPGKVLPTPRPRTAIDRAKWVRSVHRHRSLVDEVNAARARKG